MGMVFTVDEIKHYLGGHKTIEAAIDNISGQAIASCIPITNVDSLNFKKNDANLEKYETMIGMSKQKSYQRTLHQKSGGKEGRKWMALSPKWIDGHKLETEFEIAYWVNYGDDNTYGWFSVEQIQQWFANPGIQLHELGGRKER